MADFLVVKSLTAHDLKYFDCLFEGADKRGQEGISLSDKVLVEEFYSELDAHANFQPRGEICFPLTMYGPGGAGPQSVSCKLTKEGRNGKWLLSRDTFHDPKGQSERYKRMRPADIAVIGFFGYGAPSAVTMVVLSATTLEDQTLITTLAPLASLGPRRTMASISERALEEAVIRTHVSYSHPLRSLATDREILAVLEDLALGGDEGQVVLSRRWGAHRQLTHDELAQATERAAETKSHAEVLVNRYLAGKENPGGGWDHGWVSKNDPISSYDFLCELEGGRLGDQLISIGVKATLGPWTSNFHCATRELSYAASASDPHYIYRMSDMDQSGGILRISCDIREIARNVLEQHDSAAPEGVSANSFSMSTSTPGLSWGEPLWIDAPQEKPDYSWVARSLRARPKNSE